MNVTVIRRDGETSLIEWFKDGNRNRSWVPTKTLTENESGVLHDNPQWGVPHGLMWELVDITPVTASALAQELRNNGIFTADDLSANLNTAKGVLIGMIGVSVNKLIQFSRAEV